MTSAIFNHVKNLVEKGKKNACKKMFKKVKTKIQEKLENFVK